MKKLLVLSFLFISFHSFTFAAGPSKQWDKTFGSTSNDTGKAVQQTSDGGYVIAGYSKSPAGGDKSQNSRGDNDYWIIKTDVKGNKEWDKRFGGTTNDTASAVLETSDGGYIIAGSSSSGIGGDKTQASQGEKDYWIVKLDSSGTKEWDKRFGGTSNDSASAICEASDGCYVIAGSSDSDTSGNKVGASRGLADMWVVKISPIGVKLWDRTYGGASNEIATAIQQTSDGGYIVIGSSDSPISGEKSQSCRGEADYWAVKIATNGAKQWDKRFGGTGSDYAMAGLEATDGGYLLTGLSESGISVDKSQPSRGTYDYWAVRISEIGVKIWDKRFGGTAMDVLSSVDETAEGGFILGGYSLSDIGADKSERLIGAADFWIVKISGGGAKLWDKTLGGTFINSLFSIKQTRDGGYIAAGYSNSPTNGFKSEISKGVEDFWIIKLLGTTRNNFNPDYSSDLAVFDNSEGYWYARTIPGATVVWADQWGWSGANPVPGDYNGDNISDLAVFDNADGYWYIKSVFGTVISWADQWGWSGANPVPGNYDGDGIDDLAVFDNADGYWYIKSVAGTVIAWADQWGWAGANPVSGDYDGDGLDDLAVFDTTTGYWYIKSVAGTVITWGNQWGWAGAIPVPGDYDGDGLDDLAVFDTTTGYWYIKSVAGSVIAWGDQWGWASALPVSGDYNKDGISDLALFDSNTGYWYIKTVAGSVITWADQWGWAGANPIGSSQ